MNNIGFGIMCFGDKEFHKDAYKKLHEILYYGYDCYILTDDPGYFAFYGHTILYDREVKSYHDKIQLVKYLQRKHDIGILIDADLIIKDYTFLSDLETYTFKPGISYVDVLSNHPSHKRFVKELDLTRRTWKNYERYARSIYPYFVDLELMWEYFMVFNFREGDDHHTFFRHYEKLQLAKEFSEIHSNDVIGCGEGISISIAANLSKIPCERDRDLYDIVKNISHNRSKKFMRNDSE